MSVLDRAAIWTIGKCGVGWRCATCGRSFAHNGKPRRTFLALLDHVVLDHHRLPQPYSKAELTLTPTVAAVPVTWTGTSATNTWTATFISVTPDLNGGSS